VPDPSLLDRYAELAVRVGANVQPGQELEIICLVEHAPMARAISRAAWSAGASYVSVSYRDQHLKRDLIEHGAEDALTWTPPWLMTQFEHMVEAKGALVEITGNPEPDLYAGLDEARIGRTRMLELAEFTGRMTNDGLMSWTIVSFPTEGWATRVFGEPDVERLWKAVEAAVRLDAAEPVEAWRTHVAKLLHRADRLNERRFTALRYRGPGTDLTVGLAEGSIWRAAEFTTAWGTKHIPNLPTEEVFTTPDPQKAEGVVRSTRPLSLPGHGIVVRDLELEFENGRVTDVRASSGADVIRAQTKLDEGAARLGELALVDGESAVGKTGITFWDTLLDENATSHIAYGRGIAMCIEGAMGLSPEEQRALGVNESVIHTDFMVGGPEVDIDGVTGDGALVPILRDDVWQLT
jgi:aminopeptidase